jgi:hypothetical protein
MNRKLTLIHINIDSICTFLDLLVNFYECKVLLYLVEVVGTTYLNKLYITVDLCVGVLHFFIFLKSIF